METRLPEMNKSLSALILLAPLLAACATSANPETGGRMHTWDYEVRSHQPPCQMVTTVHRSGGIMSQHKQCPPPVQYCVHARTGVRIDCPHISAKHRQEDFQTNMKVYEAARRSHEQEDCRMVAEYNRTRPKGSEALTVSGGADNPYCYADGRPKR